MDFPLYPPPPANNPLAAAWGGTPSSGGGVPLPSGLQQVINQFAQQSGGGYGSNDLASLGLSSQAGLNNQVVTDYGSPATGYDAFHGTTLGGRPQQQQTIQDLLNDFYGHWSRDRIAQLGSQLASAGWVTPGKENDVAEVGSAYEKLLRLTAAMQNAGRNLTPDQILAQFVNGGGLGGRPTTYTQTDTITDLTDPTKARQILMTDLTDRLGRAPSAPEYQAFIAALHQAETDNPTVRSTTYTLDPTTGQYKASNTKVSGGLGGSSSYGGSAMGAEAYGQQYAMGQQFQPEHSAYQAAGVLMPALMQAVAATV